MRPSTFIVTISFLLTTYSTATLSDTVCDAADCTIILMFPTGGTINTEQGATLVFGIGGKISLGQDGSYVLGDTGSLNGVTKADLLVGGEITEHSRIVLGANSGINFGNDGYINLGVGGNIDYAPDSKVDINTLGQVGLTANNIVLENNPQPSGGIFFNSTLVTSAFTVTADSIHGTMITAAGQINEPQPGTCDSQNPANNSNSGSISLGSGSAQNSGNVSTSGGLAQIIVNSPTQESSLICVNKPNDTLVPFDPNVTLTVQPSQENSNSDDGGGGFVSIQFLLLVLISIGFRLLSYAQRYFRK
jgi:hypothetical protein